MIQTIRIWPCAASALLVLAAATFIQSCSQLNSFTYVMPEYRDRMIRDASLTIAQVRPTIRSIDDVTDALGPGNPLAVYRKHFDSVFPAAVRKYSWCSEVMVDAFKTPPKLLPTTLSEETGPHLKVELPAIGTTVEFARSIPDFVIFLHNVQVYRETSTTPQAAQGTTFGPISVSSVIHTADFVLWDNIAGRIVTYGKAQAEASGSSEPSKNGWRAVLYSLARQTLLNSPLYRSTETNAPTNNAPTAANISAPLARAAQVLPDRPQPLTPELDAAIRVFNAETGGDKVVITTQRLVHRRFVTFPPVIFFERGSDALPNRYIQLTPDAATRFSTDSLATASIHTIYCTALNIAGSRLRAFPSASVKIRAIPVKGEAAELAQRRCTRIRDYFVNVWGIGSKRISIASADSNFVAAAPYVELESSSPIIFGPVAIPYMVVENFAQGIGISNTIRSDAGIRAWQTFILHGSDTLSIISGFGNVAEETLQPELRLGDTDRNAFLEPLRIEFHVEDSTGQSVSAYDTLALVFGNDAVQPAKESLSFFVLNPERPYPNAAQSFDALMTVLESSIQPNATVLLTTPHARPQAKRFAENIIAKAGISKDAVTFDRDQSRKTEILMAFPELSHPESKFFAESILLTVLQ